MSREAFEPIRQGLEEVLSMVRSPDFVLRQQVTIALNALQQVSLGDEGAEATAKDALVRIIDLVPPALSPKED